MSQKVSALEITDICDELSEDLRRELIQNKVICVSKLNSNLKQFYELKDEIKRLENELKFSNKCLITLNKFKHYLTDIWPKIEDNIDLDKKQELIYLENEYQLMIETFNEKIRRSNSVIKTTEIVLAENNESDDNDSGNGFNESNDYSDNEKPMNSSADVLTENYRNLIRNAIKTRINSNKLSENSNTGQNSYICESIGCGFVAENERQLYLHKNSRHREDRHSKMKCHSCDFSTKYISVLKRHEISFHSNERRFKCEICDKRFTRKFVLEQHLLGIHYRPKKNPKRRFKCPVEGCVWSYDKTNNSTLYKHLVYSKSHLELEFDPNLKYKCNECTFRCDKKNWLDSHMRVHSNDVFPCNLCHKVYKSADSMKSHLKCVHSTTPEKSFKCTAEDCNQYFSSVCLRAKHLNSEHNISKSFPCDDSYSDSVCDFVSQNSTELQNNENSNTGQNSYVCESIGCGFVAQNERLLYWHKTSEHREDRHSNIKCHSCDFTCKFISGIKRHEICHSNERSFKCHICDKTFKSKIHLEMHENNTHINPNSKSGFPSDYLRAENTNSENISNSSNDHGCDPGCKTKKSVGTEEELNSNFRDEAVDENQINISEDILNVENEFVNEVEVIDESVDNHSEVVLSVNVSESQTNDFVSKNSTELQNNENSNTGQNSYVCESIGCGFVAQNERQLYLHKNSEHREDRHSKLKCHSCDYTCKFISVLKRHRLIHHSNERPFKCKYCDRRFKLKFNLKLHKNNIHKKPINTFNYKCFFAECDQHFNTTKQRTYHMKSKHTSKSKQCKDPDYEPGIDVESEKSAEPQINLKRDKTIDDSKERPFKCHICEKGFTRKSVLKEHLLRIHYKPIPKKCLNLRVKCPVEGCDWSNDKYEALYRHLVYSKSHLELEFDPNLKYKCNECTFRCDKQNWLDLHKAVHSNEVFPCHLCDKVYKSADSMKSHLKCVHSTTPEKSFKCTAEDCNQYFSSEYLRSSHLKHKHNIKKSYQCDWPGCGFTSINSNKLKDHKYIHTGESPYICQINGCGFVAKTSSQFSRHKYSRHREILPLKIKCDSCDFRCVNRRELKRHEIRYHVTERPFKCQICGKDFKTKGGINRHEREVHNISLNPVLYKCTFAECEQQFNTTKQRATHLKNAHKIVKRHPCTFPDCGQIFPNYPLKNKHQELVHIKRFRCEWPGCEFIGAHRTALINHKYIHTQKTPFICDWPECGFMARNKYTLITHNLRHTGERPFPCPWPGCEQRFRQSATLDTHKRWHNNDRCYKCEVPGCDFATHDRSHLRSHRIQHQKRSQPNNRLVTKTKTNIKKTKRNIRKPKRYESDSEYSDSE